MHVALLLFIKRTISPHCGVFNIFYIEPSLKCILLINLQPKTLIKKRVFFFQIRLICILLHVFLISLFINDLATNQIITHTETEYYLQQQQQQQQQYYHNLQTLIIHSNDSHGNGCTVSLSNSE